MSPYVHAKSFTMAVGNPLPPLVGPTVEAEPSHSTHNSIETLVVVLAVITLVGVIAGIIARLCGGRSHAEHDVEGWVERKCRSCIDAGISAQPKPAAAHEEAKK
ncbi:fission regulator-like protein [Perilla frutescens var. hirtella]|uniref:Fission regulator-like protein n=1 Tax=Perilla frutescens var. hirtella TaxID=608512 RepID=A0AAD4J3D0_PERFH|nr:fission regulator-like protein [Perilla frutescens var. frutescens]KAH6793875.1 fission regulator-like protein [Perilla frutescens var. hirtella]KAH6826116.1 fission regulator-like protein [Perilla frutescens var. hirtella]